MYKKLTTVLLFLGLMATSAVAQDRTSTKQNETITVNGVSFTMVYVPGGTFTMGCTGEQGSDCEDDEKPTHQVTLSSYYMGETEVTQALWRAVMGGEPSEGWSDEYGLGGRYPAYNVSNDEILDFISRLNELTGRTFSLPIEAEWEFAARGGKSGNFKYSGGNSIDDVAWYDGNSGGMSHPVKGKRPNALGLYDMSGNVYERCLDWYDNYSSGSQTNPKGPSSGSGVVFRGGCWYFIAKACRVSRRLNYDINDIDKYGGFRLVLHSKTSSTSSQDQTTGDNKTTKPKETFTVNGVSFIMIRVPSGTFTMGCTGEQGSDCEEDERPAHQVTLSSYYMGETEVTQALWRAVMGGEPSKGWSDEYGLGGKYPAYNVSYDEILEFISRLNELTGRTFSLPTEAEWEYAARGGKSGGYKYSGSNSVDDVAWHDGNSGGKNHTVKGKRPNALGLYDMSGNVYERCLDWYDVYSSGSQTNPQGPSAGSDVIFRGGSWFFYAKACRVSRRLNYSINDIDNCGGFRLVLH